tara:strand:+ start:153 stop:371 length:219 start_codon:yes stop_codon:yes gene_type:complete
MDKVSFEEIISILAMHGRPDLIADFKDSIKIDADYKPPLRNDVDSLSDDEGTATSESDYEVDVDSEGFCSLK